MTKNTNVDSNSLREIVELLSSLLKLLYPFPDPGDGSNSVAESETEPDLGTLNPDILTLADFKRRYQLTGLGPLAIMAIERTQRIIRASKNYAEIGLCEFHIGLIYLDQNDYQGAIQQFQEARMQWSFVDQIAAICLTHFAEGLAQQHRQAYELALNQFQKVLNCQKRLELELDSENLDEFGHKLREQLKKAQDETRKALWALTPPPTIDEAGEEEEDTAVPPPASPLTPETTEENAAPSQQEILPPFMPKAPPYQSKSPVLKHANTNKQLAWYQVHIQRDDPLFANIKDLGWLLVNRTGDKHQYKEGDLIVVASNDPKNNASIILKPWLPEGQVFPQICLARTELSVDFDISDEGQVQFSSKIRQIPVASKHILGYVVGLWLEIGESEILES